MSSTCSTSCNVLLSQNVNNSLLVAEHSSIFSCGMCSQALKDVAEMSTAVLPHQQRSKGKLGLQAKLHWADCNITYERTDVERR